MQIKTCFETRFECHFWETMQLYMKLTLANAKIYEAILLICVNIICDICSRIHFVQYCNRLWYNIRIPNQTSFTLKRIPPLYELKMSIYLHYLNSFTCNVYSRGLSIRKAMLWIWLFLPKFNSKHFFIPILTSRYLNDFQTVVKLKYIHNLRAAKHCIQQCIQYFT